MNQSSINQLQLGFIGLGRMGAAMVRRIQQAGVSCVVYDQNAAIRQQLPGSVIFNSSLEELVKNMKAPRHIWLMLPAAVVDSVIAQLKPLLEKGDTLIDGGNSHFTEDIRRANALKAEGIHYMDVGVSGGVWGEERGYCQMIGGPKDHYEYLEPVFRALAPGADAAPRTEGNKGEPSPAEQGYLHCGPSGAGHFVKMVHNGIEYGLMAAYAEGLNILKHADQGLNPVAADAETAPLEHPEYYQYKLPVGEISELWRRGSVVGSWLLDLIAQEMHQSPDLENYAGRISDSGEGRWTSTAAIDLGVPAPVLTSALYSRFASRGNDLFADRVQSAMRHAFGGHKEKAADQGESE
ncbi:phosphogluconate dehydrogenase (NAD(+)-dependent, decarboxylating) [Providencia burhodogranariea]|uniref:6-phosphogluconate dehydrogenase n=1 Tax=Providencia burhodogranariea DSM 19968 TaxID=1141662 RepID=K8W847_9GAMM|nr:6-phosphogluconate dehydrogenase [Providencia burhodogranariea DSM 19968]